MGSQSVRGAAALFLAAWASVSLAAPPAPQATATAGGVKQLRFAWNAVSGASSYELWFLANAGSQPVRFFQMPSSQRSVINNVSVHLLDWTNARYWVNACDSSGCSSSSQLAVGNLMLDTIGVFNSPSQQAATQFGFDVVVSGDGSTLAAAAPLESTQDTRFPKGSVYLYRKSGGGWQLQQAIPFDLSRDADSGGVDLALSGDGKILAVGLPGDVPHGTDAGYGFGAVKVFRFSDGNGWRLDATIGQLTGFELGSSDQVELDATGRTLAIKTEIGRSGVYIYTYDSAGSWSHTGTVIGHGNAPENGEQCGHFAFSSDGKVVARQCSAFYPSQLRWFEVYAAPGWSIRDTIPVPAGSSMRALSADATGDLLAVSTWVDFVPDNSRVEIYRRVSGAYQREATLSRGAWEANASEVPAQDAFGWAGRFSGDGKLLAIGYPGDHGAGVGALAPPLTAGTKPTGAVYVYERRTNGWNLRRVVKPGRAGASYETGTFGRTIGFGDNGKTLAVGQPAANNNGGVVWLY